MLPSFETDRFFLRPRGLADLQAVNGISAAMAQVIVDFFSARG